MMILITSQFDYREPFISVRTFVSYIEPIDDGACV